MSPEEIELFQSYRSNISQSFQLFKKTNEAINNQEKHLRMLKVQVEKEYEIFEAERAAAKKILDDLKREINTERSMLINLKKQSNFYRRRVTHLGKKKNRRPTKMHTGRRELKKSEGSFVKKSNVALYE